MNAPALPNFDQLLDLARNSPEELERLRQEMTHQILESTPNRGMRQRLEHLVFRIEAERRRGRTHLALCLHYSTLMHDQLLTLHHELQRLLHPVSQTSHLVQSKAPMQPTAKIIPFSSGQKTL